MNISPLGTPHLFHSRCASPHSVLFAPNYSESERKTVHLLVLTHRSLALEDSLFQSTITLAAHRASPSTTLEVYLFQFTIILAVPYASLPFHTSAVSLASPSYHFTYWFLCPRVLGRHHTSASNLRGVLSRVYSNKYHPGSASNRLWWVRSTESCGLWDWSFAFPFEFQASHVKDDGPHWRLDSGWCAMWVLFFRKLRHL